MPRIRLRAGQYILSASVTKRMGDEQLAALNSGKRRDVPRNIRDEMIRLEREQPNEGDAS